MQKNYNVVFDDSVDGCYFPRPDLVLIKDNIIAIIDEAFELSQTSTFVNIVCFSNPTQSFEKLRDNDEGHLSIGTAIYGNTLYISPKIIWSEYFRNLGYRRKVQRSVCSAEKLSYDRYLWIYLRNTIAAEIKRYEKMINS